MDILRLCICYGSFPLVFLAAQFSAYWGIKQGFEHPIVLAAIVICTALIILILERIHPAHKRWNQSHQDIATDATHALISQIVLPKLLEFTILAVILGFSIQLSESMNLILWPDSWSIGLQLILAMLISQFGEYWWHRLLHEQPLLWRLHSIHHSPERLYWLNAARFHPLDTAGSYCIAVIPLGILGIGPDVLLLISVWIAVHGLFQHCNIHLRLGPLNYIFSMAELHRWHHSLQLEEANNNYGNNIIFWDLIFGTFYLPKDKDASGDIGLANTSDFPKDYLGQLVVPWRWKW